VSDREQTLFEWIQEVRDSRAKKSTQPSADEIVRHQFSKEDMRNFRWLVTADDVRAFGVAVDPEAPEEPEEITRVVGIGDPITGEPLQQIRLTLDLGGEEDSDGSDVQQCDPQPAGAEDEDGAD
jgi:hypothetical protein